jgi:hypothetical protein
MPSDSPDQSAKSVKRWWPQYSLRAFLVVVTLVCLWLGWEANRARRQKQAVDEVLRLGGVVRFDYQLDDKGGLVDDAQPSAPAWLREALGDEHFRKVVTLDLSYGGPRLGENRITDERLTLIEGVPDLTTLELGRGFEITDEGLVHLRGLTNLKVLYLYNTSVEGPGLRHLTRLKRLEYLALNGAPVTDEGLSQIARFPRLRSLNVAATRITDDGLKHLAGLRTLEQLRLSDMDITDTGLVHLEGLTAATSIEIARTKVTGAGIRRLQAALPKCRITPDAVELERKPVEIALWPEGQRPTAAELMTRAKELGVQLYVDTDAKQPAGPIVAVSVFNSNVSADSLLRLLAETPELEVLNLRDLVVGDDLLKEMPLLPKLRYLSLQDCGITDSAIPHLVQQTSLKDLIVDENSISDKGAAMLNKLTNLERLSLSDNRVTYKARLELKRGMPRCQMGL